MSGYVIRKIDDFSDEETAMLRADVEQAERGYSLEELAQGERRMKGRPLSVGSTPAQKVVRVRLDSEREAKLRQYMREHDLTQSAAVRDLLDKALASL